MHFFPLSLLPTLALSATICQDIFDVPEMLDACCTEMYSRVHGPCPEPVFVANATDCTVEAYPEGWACCIDKEDKEQPEWEWACAPSGAFDEGGNSTGGMAMAAWSGEGLWRKMKK